MKGNGAMKAAEGSTKTYSETELTVQEWGIKEGLRLFGITIADYKEPENGKLKPMAKAYFTDTGFKTMTLIYFDVKEKGGKVTVSRSKAMGKNTKWPIKFARTKNFESDFIDPICPLYYVLVDRKIILPFKGVIKQKEWAALPFEDGEGIKPTRI